MILRMKSGSGGGGPISDSGSGGGAFGHSNAGEQWFTNVPGLITICPSTPYDAKGLLIEASRSQSPVVFLERGRLYRADAPTAHKGGAPIAELAALWNVPDGYYTEPIGKARTHPHRRGHARGDDCQLGHDAAGVGDRGGALRRGQGGAVDVIDLRTLAPFDEEAIRASVRADESRDRRDRGGGLHELRAAHPLVDHRALLLDLDAAPVLIRAIAAPAAPYNGPEETAFYPTAKDIEDALIHLARD